jgi:hypothetical protein
MSLLDLLSRLSVFPGRLLFRNFQLRLIFTSIKNFFSARLLNLGYKQGIQCVHLPLVLARFYSLY